MCKRKGGISSMVSTKSKQKRNRVNRYFEFREVNSPNFEDDFEDFYIRSIIWVTVKVPPSSTWTIDQMGSPKCAPRDVTKLHFVLYKPVCPGDISSTDTKI